MTFDSFSDFNIHLCAGDSLTQLLQDDFTLECPSLLERVQEFLMSSSSKLINANVMLFNQALSTNDVENISSLCTQVSGKKIYLTLLASPNFIKTFDQLHSMKMAGLSSITFHSYHQCITRHVYPNFLKLAGWAEELKMPIFVDGSYGTLDIYNIDNLDFIAYLVSLVKNTPIVIMHSGGARVLEAMLLVESTSNLFLETSFTLPYYIGSSVENDLAFAYKKIGPERVVYGSDQPYVSAKSSMSSTLAFFEKYKFQVTSQEWILFRTFSRIFGI